MRRRHAPGSDASLVLGAEIKEHFVWFALVDRRDLGLHPDIGFNHFGIEPEILSSRIQFVELPFHFVFKIKQPPEHDPHPHGWVERVHCDVSAYDIIGWGVGSLSVLQACVHFSCQDIRAHDAYILVHELVHVHRVLVVVVCAEKTLRVHSHCLFRIFYTLFGVSQRCEVAEQKSV